MDWANERYVRVYTRDTGDWLMWPWQTRALLVFLFRKVDRSGVLCLGKGRLRALSAVVGMPAEELSTAIEPLIEDGCVQLTEDTLIIPNFMEAQETPQSDRLRKEASRKKARDEAIVRVGHARSRAVTRGHAESQSVTPTQTRPDQTEPCSDARTGSEDARSQTRLKSVPPLPPASEDHARFEDKLRSLPKLADLDLADLADQCVAKLIAGAKPAWILEAIQDASDKSQRGEQAHFRHARVVAFVRHAKPPRVEQAEALEVKSGPAYREDDDSETIARLRRMPKRQTAQEAPASLGDLVGKLKHGGAA